MKVKVVNFDNTVTGEVSLDKSIYGVEVKVDVLHAVVEWQRAARRSGNHKTKGISEISGTTKKPFKQKGTGRARQGSLRSPHMRGGAVIFGPVVRDHAYDLPKKVRKLALRMALSSKYSEAKLVVVENLDISNHKTKDLNKKLQAIAGASALIVGLDKEKDINFVRASRNLHSFNVLPVEGLNVYDLIKHDYIIVAKDSIASITKRLG